MDHVQMCNSQIQFDDNVVKSIAEICPRVFRWVVNQCEGRLTI